MAHASGLARQEDDLALDGTAPALDESRLLRLHGEAFTLTVLPLANFRDADFIQSLGREIARAPSFFRRAPVVLDLEGLSHCSEDELAELAARLRDCLLMPVGVRNATDEQNEAAARIGLSVFPMWRSATATTAAPAKRAKDDEARNIVQREPVRCGQQVRAPDGDLIVLAPVSTGAELYAKGHIHVYGPLRGRAFAGCDGDEEAYIFCQAFEPELVSIAGRWLVRDDMDDFVIGNSVQIFRSGRRLLVEPLH